MPIVRIALAAALVLAAAPAAAQTRDFLIGDEGNLMTAVAAHTRSSESAWHNPAGLSAVTGTRLQLSGSLYSVSRQRFEDLLVTSTPGGDVSTTFKSQSISTLPNAVVGATPLDDGITGALGIYVPITDEIDGVGDDDAIVNISGEDVRIQQRIRLRGEGNRYYAGPSVGARLHERFSAGAALLGVYYHEETFLQSLLSLESVTTPGAFSFAASRNEENTIDRIGIAGTLGLQWEPVDRLFLGLVLRTPEYSIWEDVKTARTAVDASTTPPAVVVSSTKDSDDDFRFSDASPWRIATGIAGRLGPALISGEVEMAFPFESHRLDAKTRFDVDGRVGVLWDLSPAWSLGAGTYLDANSFRRTDDGGDTRLHKLGVTAGVQYRLNLEVVTEGDGRAPLAITTTIAVRYAYGWGEFDGLVFRTADGTFSRSSEDVTSNEAALYVGAGLRF